MTPPLQSVDHCRYVVLAQPDPAALPRVLELFAQRNLIPDHVSCQRSSSDDGDDRLMVEIAIKPCQFGTDCSAQDVLAAKLAQIVIVENVQFFKAEVAVRAVA